MSSTLYYTILVISAIGAVSAIVLYYISQRFRVEEDHRIDEVEALLPGSNCASCGYAGCRAFAEACVSADQLTGLVCPVGGNETAIALASLLGKEKAEVIPVTAVVRCEGSCDVRPRTSRYEGVKTCLSITSLYGGETGCRYGCHGFSDCVRACLFDAIHMNPATGLPVVDAVKCNGCGACEAACPVGLIEMRRKMPGNRQIFVACRNKDPEPRASNACSVACTACGNCMEACGFDAIRISNNLATIDAWKCTLCRKCVSVCPSRSIREVNFPARKIKSPGELVQS